MMMEAMSAPTTPITRKLVKQATTDKEPELNSLALGNANDDAKIGKTATVDSTKPRRQLKRRISCKGVPSVEPAAAQPTTTPEPSIQQAPETPRRELKRRLSGKQSCESIGESSAAAPKPALVRRELKRRLSDKTPAELATPAAKKDDSEVPTKSVADVITEQLSSAKLGRQKRALAHLRERAESGAARVQGRIVLDTDVAEAIEKLRKLRGLKTATPKGSLAKKRHLPTTEGKEEEALSEQEKDAANSSDSDNSSESDSGSDGDSDGQSDLGSEEEVDNEIDAGPAVLKDLMMGELPVNEDPSYRGDWSNAPAVGSLGFNAFAADTMKAVGVASAPLQANFDESISCPPLQPHQEAAVFLLHPQSPVSRLLVDHPTGSGKTREMISVLDNYFFDPRPKVPIFPKEPVCQNFYVELLRWPSQYRDFFCCMRPEDAMLASGAKDWKSKRAHMWSLAGLADEELRRICRVLRDVLELKGYFYMGRMRESLRAAFAQRFPGETCIPGGPLRALRYTSAGGGHARLKERDGLPASAMMKIGFDRNGFDTNVYSNKIVIMDEVHNLVRTQTMYGEQLARLRDLLSTATGAVVAGFTGTPILSEPSEGRQLLDIIKGSDAKLRALGDEGFISSFHVRPAPLFPLSLPRGVPDAILTPQLRRQFIKKVSLSGEPLQKYDIKRNKGLPTQRLRAYCNMCIYFGNFHDGKTGNKSRVMADFAACAPKLDAMVNDVANDASKALVLVAKNTGMAAVLARLREVAEKSSPPFGVATMEDLASFNSVENLRGERYRVIVADANTCSEGVSFLAVRRVLLADVPNTPSSLVQSVGRAIRMYGHKGLPQDEQTVTTTMYVSKFPSWMRSSLGSWAYRAQPKLEDAKRMESKARKLLRNLHRVGIKELEDLKRKVDEFVLRQGASRRSTIFKDQDKQQHVDFVSFLEQVGLWEEAKRVRLCQQNARPAGKRLRTTVAPRGPNAGAAIKRHYLIRALNALASAGSSAEEVVNKLGLSPYTADEEAVAMLSKRSREIVPALAELRRKAVDGDVLGALVDGAQQEEAVSEGESSACELDLGESSGGEDDDGGKVGGKMTAPILLPPGWHMHRFQRGSWNGREYVDPEGNIYRTDKHVREAIDAVRRRDNLAARHAALGAKFRARQAAKLQESQGSGEIGDSQSSDPLQQEVDAFFSTSSPSIDIPTTPDTVSAAEEELASTTPDATASSVSVENPPDSLLSLPPPDSSHTSTQESSPDSLAVTRAPCIPCEDEMRSQWMDSSPTSSTSCSELVQMEDPAQAKLTTYFSQAVLGTREGEEIA